MFLTLRHIYYAYAYIYMSIGTKSCCSVLELIPRPSVLESVHVIGNIIYNVI